MRLIVYASFLILCCAILRTSSAENKGHKRRRTEEDDGVERPLNYGGDKKFKTRYRSETADNSEEDYRVNKRHSGKPREESDFTRGKRHSKYAEGASGFEDAGEEPRAYRKSKKSYDARRGKESEGSRRRFDKKRSDDSDEDGSEDFVPRKKQSKKFARSKVEEESRAEGTARSEKYPDRRRKDTRREDDGSSEEETAKYEKKSTGRGEKPVDRSESEGEAPKREFRRKIRVRIPDSPEEEDSEGSDEDGGTCEKKWKRGGGSRGCRDEESANGDDEGEEPVRAKKIKYSIKFAHEKERGGPSEDNNIMMKIHRGEKKKYRYQDDDDEDSSEEQGHPKRFRFLDDDEE